MPSLDKVSSGWQSFVMRVRASYFHARKFVRQTSQKLERVITEVFKLRKIIAAVPVAIGAIYIALYNMSKLPKVVGIDLLETGAFTYQIPKGIAVFTPLAITGMCLLLMFCSKRILTPWMVSLFSLLIPIAILLTNIFPA